jgi:hypothetical protein
VSGANITLQVKVWDSLDASSTSVFSDIATTSPLLSSAEAALDAIVALGETTLTVEAFTTYFLYPVELSAAPRLNTSTRVKVLDAALAFLWTQEALYIGNAETAVHFVEKMTDPEGGDLPPEVRVVVMVMVVVVMMMMTMMMMMVVVVMVNHRWRIRRCRCCGRRWPR